MSGHVIKDFLVALGFKIDSNGLKNSKDALNDITQNAAKLDKALIALSTTAVIFVGKVANEFEKLHYASQRIGATADNIKGFEAAIANMGGSAESALQSLESVARKMRESPGYEGMIKGLGVATRDQNGQMRDRVAVVQDLGKAFKGMEYYRAKAYANTLGIDENTLMAMRDGKFNDNLQKYQMLRQKLGINNEMAKDGQQLAAEYRDLGSTTKAIMDAIVATAGKALLPILKGINAVLGGMVSAFAALPDWIKSILSTGLQLGFLLLLFGGLAAAARLLGFAFGLVRMALSGVLLRLVGVLGRLSALLPLMRVLLTLLRGIAVAFMATPIGRVLALAAALAALWDDYQTWKRGGESLLDWDVWSKGIDDAIRGMQKIGEWLDKLRGKAVDLVSTGMEKTVNAYHQTVDAVSIGMDKAADAASSFIASAHAENVSGAGGAFGQVVADGESKNSGGYGAYNTGTKGKLRSGSEDLSKRTINDLLKASQLSGNDPNRRFAVGKYQVIPDTMREAMKSMKLTGEETFTPAMQERIFREFLLKKKRPAIYDYLTGKSNDRTKAQVATSQEWASAGVPTAMQGAKRMLQAGQSYYAGDGANKAHAGAEKYGKALDADRAKIMQLMQQGYSEKEAVDAVLGGMTLPTKEKKPSRRAVGVNADNAARNATVPLTANPHREQQTAVASQGQARGATIAQSTVIHVNGSADPRATAAAVAREQHNVNTHLARNAQRPVS